MTGGLGAGIRVYPRENIIMAYACCLDACYSGSALFSASIIHHDQQLPQLWSASNEPAQYTLCLVRSPQSAACFLLLPFIWHSRRWNYRIIKKKVITSRLNKPAVSS